MNDIPTISADQANQEFENFCDEMELDFDKSTMDEQDREGFEKNKQIIIKAIQKGNLTFNESNEPLFNCRRSGKDSTRLRFTEPTGACFQAMDKGKKDHDIAKMHNMMAQMTHQTPGFFADVPNRDYKVLSAIVTLFLA